MYARNDNPSTARHFQQFLYTCISHAHVSFFALPFWWRIALLCESRHAIVLFDSVIQGSLNNHCGNTPDTLGVKLSIKKEFVPCFVISGKPSKGKAKRILLCKLIFPPSTSVIVILQRLEAFTCKNCSFQLWYLFMIWTSIDLTKICNRAQVQLNH